MESKDPKSTASADAAEGVESKDPRSDATSADTLSDMDEIEKISGTGEDETDEGEDSSAPSPDGAFDEGRSSDGLEDAGPM
jgi:hypothetical protein